VQEAVTRFYRLSVQLAFNIVVLVLVLGLFVGVVRLLLGLGETLGGHDLAEGFHLLISNALTLVVVIELVRTFVDYFEWQRVRIHVLLDAGAVFLLRELFIGLHDQALTATGVLLWASGVLLLVVARTLAIRYAPDTVENPV
jgi:uncharacterized membrane protein (DUF373 family)